MKKYKEIEIIGDEKNIDVVWIDHKRLIELEQKDDYPKLCCYHALVKRQTGAFKGHAITLPDIWDRVIGEDKEGTLCLIPLLKEEDM